MVKISASILCSAWQNMMMIMTMPTLSFNKKIHVVNVSWVFSAQIPPILLHPDCTYRINDFVFGVVTALQETDYPNVVWYNIVAYYNQLYLGGNLAVALLLRGLGVSDTSTKGHRSSHMTLHIKIIEELESSLTIP